MNLTGIEGSTSHTLFEDAIRDEWPELSNDAVEMILEEVRLLEEHEREDKLPSEASKIITIRADGVSSYKVTVTDLVRELGLDIGDQVQVTLRRLP